MIHKIGRHRLSQQRINSKKFEHPADVVRWMGAMQAQDYGQAVWALGCRTQSATLASIEAAISARQLIRTWPMRGTIHFVPPEDARWMLALTTPRILASAKRRHEQLSLDQATFQRCESILTKTLSGGKNLSRSVLLDTLEEQGISTKGGRGYHILWYLAQHGVLCIGPTEDKQQTFALLDEWVAVSRKLERDEALAELAGRYFSSHAPATVHDFAWWTGLTVTEARKGLAANKHKLEAVRVDGVEYWLHSDQSAVPDDVPAIELLPGYDEFFLGYKDRSMLAAEPEHLQQVVPGNNGVFFPMVVLHGEIVGTWKRTIKKKAVEIRMTLFAPLPEWTDALHAAAAAYGDFVGLPAVVTVE